MVNFIKVVLGALACSKKIVAQTSWQLQVGYSGKTFFDSWSFFTEPDPSNGLVKYNDRDSAFAKGLVFWTKNGTPGIQADSWTTLQPGQLRDSVRLHSQALFNGGLFIADFALMPWGCGIWPSLWTLGYGAVWPTLGEIDIVEGIQDRIHNQATIHSTPGCVTNVSPGLYRGTTGNVDCDSTNGKSGCGIVSPSNLTYGEPFNLNGGGIFSMLWDGNGIRMWEFDRNSIPNDILAGKPRPESWGVPSAAYDSSTCDTGKYFRDNQLVLTVNLCGDWAGGVYDQTPHCPGTCAEQVANPINLKNSIFLINSIKVFQLTENGAVPPPVNKIPSLGRAGQNAQGVGGGRSSNDTAPSDTGPSDKGGGGGGGRGGSGGRGGGGSGGAGRSTMTSMPIVYGWICVVLAAIHC